MVKSNAGTITLEEIWQIPEMLDRALNPKKEIMDLIEKIIEKNIKIIHLVGYGSSLYAGFVGAYLLNQMSKIKTFAEVSPEFPHLAGSILTDEDLVIGISQSGESKMTLRSLEVAKIRKSLTAALTNNKDSSLAKLTDIIMEINSTEEKSVLATKTYVNTLGVLIKFSIELAYMGKKITEEAYSNAIQELKGIPQIIKNSLPYIRKQIRHYAPYLKFTSPCFVLGSGPDYGTAMEISLKLIEGARIFSHAYSTAEFPHGPIALLADGSSWIFAVIPHEGYHRSILLKLLEKVKTRGATITGLYSTESIDDIEYGIQVPKLSEIFQPLVNIVPAQILTVELALGKGINPDKPKGLSKVSTI